MTVYAGHRIPSRQFTRPVDHKPAAVGDRGSASMRAPSCPYATTHPAR